MQPGHTIRLTLHGGDNETMEGVFILDPLLIDPEETPSFDQLPSVNTTEQPYDQKGAMAYAVVVILVYGCSIIFLIASHIFLKKKEGKKDQDDGQIDKYLEQVPSLKEKSARESFRKLKYSIIPLVAMGVSAAGRPGGKAQGPEAGGSSADGQPKPPPSPLPSIAEGDETDDPNQPLIASSSGRVVKDKSKPSHLTIPVYDHQVSIESPRPSPRTMMSPVDEGRCPWEMDVTRKGSPRPFYGSGSRGASPQASPRINVRGLTPSPTSPRKKGSSHPEQAPVCLSLEDLDDPNVGSQRDKSSSHRKSPGFRFPSPSFSPGPSGQHHFVFRPIPCTSGSSIDSSDISIEQSPEAEELVHVTCV